MRKLTLVGSFVCLATGYSHAQSARMPSAQKDAVARTEANDLLPDEQIQHVLNRLTFGARPGEASEIRATGVAKWIDVQLHPERIADAAADRLNSAYSIFSMKTAEIVAEFNAFQQMQRRTQLAAGGDSALSKKDARKTVLALNPQLAKAALLGRQLVGQVQSAKLARAVTTNRQLEEVMVDFWENHFSVFSGKGQTRLYLAQYDRDVIRPHALGKFRDLLGAVAHSPAMLFFLDNWQSAADSVHPTLAHRNGRGGGPEGLAARRPGAPGSALPRLKSPRRLPPEMLDRIRNASPEERQQMLQSAQLLPKRGSGLNENYARELMELHTLGVDGGYSQKDVQEVARALTGWTFDRQTGEFVFNPSRHDAGEKTILGRRFKSGRGEEEGDEVLDMLSRAPATARFVTAKIARHFVSDDPPKALVDRCASEFTRTDGDIRETLSCIITSPEFFSRSAFRVKVKTPFELVVSALRAVNAQPDTSARSAQLVARLGQPIFGRQTPDGWPDRGDAWMNTGAILNRINFGLSLAADRLPGARLEGWPDFESLRASSRAEQVDAVVKDLLGGQVAASTKQVLMSGDNPMLSNARGSKATDVNGMAVIDDSQQPGAGRQLNLQGLAQVVGLALGAPEFQRR